ncbi:MAG: hypothetical protein AAF678_12385 [Pseudomonadota bacterium]
MRIALILGVVAVIVAAVLAVQAYFPSLVAWALQQQRAFQNEMATAVNGLRAGESGAWVALLGAAGAYGFVHAVGPGHGKYLIGGVGLGQAVPAGRLLAIAAISSLGQALWAILLVYGGLHLLEVSARSLTTLADTYLASASYLAIGAIGLLLVWRGVRSIRKTRHIQTSAATLGGARDHVHSDDCGCHSHGVRPEDVAGLTSPRDTVMLILSIAIRPCTGAIFLLVIAWQLEIPWAGAAAAVTMGIGTGMLTSLVAISSVMARGLAYASTDRMGVITIAVPSIQILAGIMIVWFSALLLQFGIGLI